MTIICAKPLTPVLESPEVNTPPSTILASPWRGWSSLRRQRAFKNLRWPVKRREDRSDGTGEAGVGGVHCPQSATGAVVQQALRCHPFGALNSRHRFNKRVRECLAKKTTSATPKRAPIFSAKQLMRG